MKNLTLSLCLVVVTAVLGLGWFFSEIYYQINQDNVELNTELTGYQKMGRGIASTLDSLEDKQVFIKHWQKQSDFLFTLQPRESFPVPSSLIKNFDAGEPLVLQSERDLSLHFFMVNSQYVLSIEIPQDTLPPNQPVILNLALTFGFYLGLVTIVLIWLLPLIKRLILLGKTARAFGKGDLSSRIVPNQMSYISNIETEFNGMADRIQTLLDDNKLLSRAVSHDLKTPLARLRFGIETLEEANDNATRIKYRARLDKDLNEMESLIKTLLDYAWLEQANIKIQWQTIPLNNFIQELFKEELDNGVQENIVVNYQAANHNIMINADQKYLSMQLHNIFNNAVIHANSRILLNVGVRDNKPYICIEDDGEGIDVTQRQEVLKPFYRCTSTVKKQGHGMGLAIVARIAQWMPQTLMIETSTQLGGAAITLQFNK